MEHRPKYWIACSGGVDSIVLLHLMYELKEDIGILHCNFHLRGEDSNADEHFVSELAKNLNVPIHIKHFDTYQYAEEKRVNTQLAARDLRYAWFDEIVQQKGGKVMLAHHNDDQLETFFLQLRRGGKVKGLSGMPLKRDYFIRPLLKYSKEELVQLAKRNNWSWREDVSNASEDYMRNWYRISMLPFLKEINFPLADVVPLMEDFQTVKKYLGTLVYPNSFLLEEWMNLPLWYKNEVLFNYDLGEYAVKEIDRLALSEKGKMIQNERASVWNEGKKLVFVKNNDASIEVALTVKRLSKEDFSFNSHDLFFDADKIKGELSFRKWQEGDRFQPLGMKGEKTVAKFLRDRKVASHVKNEVYVVLDETKKIIGVFGFGSSELTKIDNNTNVVLQVGLKRD